MTTGNFSSVEILGHEERCRFEALTPEIAIAIGERFAEVGTKRNHPITIAIQLDGVEVFRRALPGASDEHAGWIARKANVVNLTHHSTMYERVKAEEEGINWHEAHGVVDETHAIHGGGFPLALKNGDFRGMLLVSGLPQVDDHLLAFEVLQELSHQLS
jgi:uncharacterized protein (UPF0303 family)